MLAERKEQEAARQLSEYQVLCRAEEEQLQQLVDYKAQYLGDFTQRQTSLGSAQMASYSDFIRRLSGVITEQTQKVEHLNSQLDKVRLFWRQRRHQRRAIGDLVQRLMVSEDALAERQLQKLLDEMSQSRRS